MRFSFCKIYRGWVYLFCLGGAFIFLPPLASAETPPVTLMPTYYEIAAHPGERTEQVFEFWNGTDTALPIRVVIADFQAFGEEGAVVFRAPTEAAYSLREWVHPGIEELIVEPQQKAALNFVLEIPPHIAPGSRWGAFVVATVPTIDEEGRLARIQISSNILLRVLGEAEEKLVIESFSAPGFLEKPPVTFVTRFGNEGRVHLKPRGFIEVYNFYGRKVARIPLAERNVLPGSFRRIETTVGEGFWIGRYTVKLSATYGEINSELTAQARFWVVPWKKAGIPFGILLGLGALIYRARRRFKTALYVLLTEKDPEAY